MGEPAVVRDGIGRVVGGFCDDEHIVPRFTWTDSHHDEARRIREAHARSARHERAAEAGWVRRQLGLVALVVLAVALLQVLTGCAGVRVTPELEAAVQTEAAAVAGDLDEWSHLSDEQQRASLLEAHAFAVWVADHLGVPLSAEARRGVAPGAAQARSKAGEGGR